MIKDVVVDAMIIRVSVRVNDEWWKLDQMIIPSHFLLLVYYILTFTQKSPLR